jgi:hypothetical protein
MSNKWWDPEAHSSGSYLDGKRGIVREAEFVRHNCNGHCPEATALRYRVEIPDLAEDKQPFPVDISSGKVLWPSNDGKTKDVSGPHLVHGDGGPFRVDKKTGLNIFVKALDGSGFPMEKFAESGAAALVGADVTIRGIDRSYKIDGEQKEKTYDVISEFHGFVEDGEEGGTGETPSSPDTPDAEELTAELNGLLLDALKEHGGEIPRGQLSIRLNKFVKGNLNRKQLLSLVTKDDVLGRLEGITFDKKVVSAA